ncbi:unnamed protein product [Mytilus edulis]|uniref:Uncharacterized protein n=1 Tax=Mytilus edulis TaxID=6550 RepID=A0A8S3RC71_MYTED|nr:unnamed protein product [Mytilus edulis]
MLYMENGELAPYLQSMIDMMNMDRFKEESVVFFIEFIKRSADHNTVTFYNILKMLCTIDLQREIQDLILQGFTEYLIISCNEQYSTLYKFILDINMICTKGPFLQKLTSCIAKTWLKLDDDTVNDIRKTIYHCYCTVRHYGKYEQDANIEKYKDHFTFIASMEAEEEMKKLTSLTNFLLMLTLLLIASGRHHKSAELKKYLSLKYEYRDSILYLLWCSGDVEINPGPTLCTLMKVPDSVKERNWIYEMCSILLRLLKYRSIDLKSDGLWKAKPLHWPNGWPFYDPRNKPKGQGYNTVTDRKLLENLKEQCNGKGLLKDLSKFDDEHTKSKVRQYKLEITAWKNNRTELFELYTLRQELDTLRAAKKSLHKYKNNSELHKGISDLNVDFIFDTDNVTSISSEGYTDISDGIWKMQPNEWNPNHSYYSPCNAGKRKEKGQDQKLVDNLLTYCESKNITIPADLQPLLKAWKQRNTSEITKYYTIWSKTAIINHSLKYLELEGLLEKCHVHESLKQIGLILDTQYWRCPSPKKVTSTDNDDKSQDSGFSDTSHSSHCSDSQTANLTNSSQKVLSFQKIKDNQLAKLTNSTNANLNATDDSSCGIDSHTNDHLCNTKFDLDNQWKELSNQTCLKSDKANFSILTSKAQSEHDVQHYPVLSADSTNSKQKGNYKKISQNTSKRKRPNEDESYSDLKRPYISELVASSSSMNSDAETEISDINNRITSDQYVDNIVNLLDDLEQDYSSTTGKASIQDSSSTTDQSSDVCNELPEYVQLYIDTVQNSYNPDDTLNIDIEQFIEEQDMDLS